MLRTEAPPITPRDVMRMCLHSRRVALQRLADAVQPHED